jgi:3-deoxy-D-manno-octulosonate 8-phosphate phosphatase (KDO 8-P phosphatase)
MIAYDLRKIRAMFFDVDGVLSRTSMVLAPDGMPLRTVNTKDGYALQLAAKCGFVLAVITGAKTSNLLKRYEGLGLKEIYLGCSNKIEAYESLRERYGLSDEEILYMGDDIPDFQVMQRCGLPVCPSDAVSDIQGISAYVSPKAGGEGCVRDVVEQVLRAHDKWMHQASAFGW